MRACLPILLFLLPGITTAKPYKPPPMVKHVDCIAENGHRPVDMYNSPYTILSNGSLCCPFDAYYNGESVCIDEDRVEDYCKSKGRGVTSEPCIYCRTCTKLAGETCRGPHLIHGHCDDGLQCIGTENDTKVGVCSDPVIKTTGEMCGGRLDSLGKCERGTDYCRQVERNSSSVCVRQAKTQTFNMSCGGSYGSVGRCKNDLKCTADEKKFLKGDDITGTCYKSAMKVCFKDCSEEPHGPGHYVCASDGIWYPNNCYRKQMNCQFFSSSHPHRIEKVKEVNIPQVCGEEPTEPPPSPMIVTSEEIEENGESETEDTTPTNEGTTPI